MRPGCTLVRVDVAFGQSAPVKGGIAFDSYRYVQGAVGALKSPPFAHQR
jgi:hypothetical protein